MKAHALYGFSAKLAPFAELSAQESVALLKSWGADSIFGGYDDPNFVEAAHAVGLRVMAEFGCFVGEKWWESLPESHPIMADGQPMPAQEWYAGVTPTIPAIREELLVKLAALVREKELDGVWLDFIRWPARWETPQPKLIQTSFDAHTMALFLADTGLSAPQSLLSLADWILHEHESLWTDWKCAQIVSFVREAAEVVRREAKRKCLLGVFSVPWRLADYGGAMRRIVAQDLKALAPYVDVFSPMVYHRMCGQPVGWIAAVTEEAHQLSGRPIWPIIQTMSEPNELNAAELASAMDVALEAPGSAGVILFTLKGLIEEDKLETMRTRFRAGK